jgi:sarcosine oxidase delta subunit
MNLSNILFIRRKRFTCKMQEGDDLLDHVNKVKAFGDQLACLKVPVRDKDIVRTLLESLAASYEYLVTAIEMMPMKDLTMDYMTARLMHEMSKRKKKEPQGKDVAIMLRQTKGINSFPPKDVKSCFYCGKPSYIAHFCYKEITNRKKKTKNVKEYNDYAFVMENEAHSKSVRKWNMDLGASKHITLHRTAFHTYEVITLRIV